MVTIELIEQNIKIAWAEIVDDELTLLAVEPDYRKQGYGEKMLMQLLTWMSKAKIKRLHFLNVRNEFWMKMQSRHPKEITLFLDGSGLIKSQTALARPLHKGAITVLDIR